MNITQEGEEQEKMKKKSIKGTTPPVDPRTDRDSNKKVKNTLHALGMKKIEEEIKAIRNSDNDNI